MSIVLETERLLLHPLQLADASRTQLLFPHWEIVRYLNASVPWPYPPDGAFTFYKEVLLPAIAQGTQWHWTLRLKDRPNEHIGSICLRHGVDDHRGFWLGIPWHGQRLMSEAAVAVTEYWFDVLEFPALRTKKASTNAASRRISEKTGMRLVSTVEHDFVEGRRLADVWEITRLEWIEWRQSMIASAPTRLKNPDTPLK